MMAATSSPADKLHWVFQMYDKDNSNTIQVVHDIDDKDIDFNDINDKDIYDKDIDDKDRGERIVF